MKWMNIHEKIRWGKIALKARLEPNKKITENHSSDLIMWEDQIEAKYWDETSINNNSTVIIFKLLEISIF